MSVTLGINPFAAQAGGATLTTASGFTSQVSGSLFAISFVSTTINTGAAASDSFSNTYSLESSAHDTVNGGYVLTFVSQLNSTGGVNHTFTATTSGGTIQAMEGVEFKGANGIDKSLFFFDNGAGFPYSSPLSTTNPGELVYAVASCFQGGNFWPLTNNGFTQLQGSHVDWNFGSGYILAPSTSAYDPLWTLSGGSAVYLSGNMVAFTSAVSAPPLLGQIWC